MTRRRLWLAVCIGLAALAQIALSTTASASPASQVVERFHTALISSMKHASELGYAGRFAQLEPAILESHQLAVIARITTGRHWRKLNTEQQSEFVSAFTKLSISTYAHNFDSYAGETFSTLSEITLPRGDTLVRTKLTKSDGGEVQFDYVLRHKEGHWKIINIMVDGVSDLALKRAEYGNILNKNGLNALIQMLHEKIIQHRSGGN
ncbi:MAG: ABC transporter substrate-binding protein [Mariprofundaceae bacterium]